MGAGILRHLPTDRASRELVGLCVLVTVAFTAWTMAAPLAPLLLLKLGAPPSLLGIVIGTGTVGSLLLAIPGGRLVGTWGSGKLMRRAIVLSTASTVIPAVFPSIAGLFATLVLMEIGKLLFILGAQAHVGALGEGRDLNLDYGWYSTAAAVGQLIGPTAAGLLADGIGPRAAWIAISVLTAAVALFLPKLVSNRTAPRKSGDAAGGAPRKSILQYLNAYTAIAMLASFAVLFADGARTTFFPVFMTERGYAATVIGFFLSLRALFSMSVRIFMGRAIKAAGGRFPALVFSILVMAVGIGITPLCTGYALLAANAALVGIGLGLAIPLSMATVSEGAAPEDRGVVMGIRLSGNRLAQLINPIFFGVIAQGFSLSLSFVAGGALLALCAIPIALFRIGGTDRDLGSSRR